MYTTGLALLLTRHFKSRYEYTQPHSLLCFCKPFFQPNPTPTPTSLTPTPSHPLKFPPLYVSVYSQHLKHWTCWPGVRPPLICCCEVNMNAYCICVMILVAIVYSLEGFKVEFSIHKLIFFACGHMLHHIADRLDHTWFLFLAPCPPCLL